MYSSKLAGLEINIHLALLCIGNRMGPSKIKD